jgi:hypothetical protein
VWPANPAEQIGYYCGRIGPGLLGEPLNSLSNIAFVIVALCGAFFLLGQGWIAVTPRGALGGGITHIPSVVLLGVVGVALLRKAIELWRYALLACGVYAAAILVRALDWEVCRVFPLGLHWLWHLLAALTGSLLLVGMAKLPPAGLSSRDGA